MSHTSYMRALLEPLGAYDLDGTYNGAELAVVGEMLDALMAQVNELEREMSLCTAESWGLDRVANLLSVSPVASNQRELADAYARLLRVGGDSSTLESVNDTVRGCGVFARVEEQSEPNQLQVTFPDTAGIPDGYADIKTIIDGILPAQALVEYVFWYKTWQMIINENCTWQMAGQLSCWEELASG